MGDYNDYFTRPDAASPSTGAPYTITTLIGSAELKSNAIHDTNTAATDTACRMEQAFATPDHEVSVRLSTLTLNGADSIGGGAVIGCDVGATPNFLLAQCNLQANTISILSMVANNFNADLGDSATLSAFAVGDVITFGRVGQFLYAQRNGTTVVTARSALNASNIRGGLYMSRGTVNVDVAWNLWHAQELSSPPVRLTTPGLVPFGRGLGMPAGVPPDTANADPAQVPDWTHHPPVRTWQQPRGSRADPVVPAEVVVTAAASPLPVLPPKLRRGMALRGHRTQVVSAQETVVSETAAKVRRSFVLLRGRRQPLVPAQATTGQSSSRTQRAFLVRSRRRDSVVPQVAVVQPTVPLPITSSKLRRAAMLRGRRQPMVPAQSAPSPPVSRNRRSFLVRGGRRVPVVPVQDGSVPPSAPHVRRPAVTRRGRTWNFVQSQVVIPRAPDWLQRPHRVRGWRLSRGKRAEFPTPQATAPVPILPLPVKQRRALRGWLLRRGASFVPVRPQVNPPYPIKPQTQARTQRGLLVRRGRQAPLVPPSGHPAPPVRSKRLLTPWRGRGSVRTPVPDQTYPVAWQARRRPTPTTRRGRASGPVSTQPQVNPPFPWTVRKQVRALRGWLLRRGRNFTPVRRPDFLPADYLGTQRADFQERTSESVTESSIVVGEERNRTGFFEQQRTDTSERSREGEDR